MGATEAMQKWLARRAKFAVVGITSVLLCLSTMGGSVANATSTASGFDWDSGDLAAASNMNKVSCPTSELCVAAGWTDSDVGRIAVSTTPVQGASSWSTFEPNADVVAISDVSCPTTSMCAAVGAHGGVPYGYALTSTSPSMGASSWTTHQIPDLTLPQAISCPTANLCVAVGIGYGIDNPMVSVSDNPTASNPTWTSAPIPFVPYDVSCASESSCVITGVTDGTIHSPETAFASAPLDGASAWVTTPYPINAVSLSCPTTSLCVGVSQAGQIATTTDPSFGGSGWTAISLPGSPNITSVTCKTATMCVATGTNGHSLVTTSTNPTGGIGAWDSETLDDTGMTGAVACATTDLCVAVIGNQVTTGIRFGLLRVTTFSAVAARISVDGWTADTWGLNWLKLTPGPHTVCFTDVPGFTRNSGCQIVTISPGQTSSLTGNYSKRGYLQVQTSPALPSTISIDGFPANDWGVWTDLPSGSHQVCWGPVSGYDAPPCQSVTVKASVPALITGTFTPNASVEGEKGKGLLRVTTSPAVPSQISVDGHIADTWGLNWLKLDPGGHQVCFSDVPGYTTPACRLVVVFADQTATTTGTFGENGYLKVETSPALPSTISIDGHPADDWGVFTDLPAGSHEVCFSGLSGWTKPACRNVTVNAGATVTTTGVFTAYQ